MGKRNPDDNWSSRSFSKCALMTFQRLVNFVEILARLCRSQERFRNCRCSSVQLSCTMWEKVLLARKDSEKNLSRRLGQGTDKGLNSTALPNGPRIETQIPDHCRTHSQTASAAPARDGRKGEFVRTQIITYRSENLSASGSCFRLSLLVLGLSRRAPQSSHTRWRCGFLYVQAAQCQPLHS